MKKVLEKSKLTKEDYQNYMGVVYDFIMDTERRMGVLDKYKKIHGLSFDEWVNFQDGSGLN